MRLPIILIAAVSVLSTAYADDKAKDVIDYRQDIMHALNEESGVVGQILSGAAPDDDLAIHLDAIAQTASTALRAFRPKVEGGEANPEVWKKWDDFSKRMSEFAAKAAELSKAAAKGESKDALGIHVVDALTCKACHDAYRLEPQQ